MPDKKSGSKKAFTADWLLRGALARIGDTVDRLMGRKWIPSSSIATSELIERIKKLLDAEAKKVPGKGLVVPHNIKLKMQWDKFSTDADDAIEKVKTELLAATVDHINDSLYYTYAPVSLDVKPDYFIEGVKLYASFDKFTEEDRDVEMNVTMPAINIAEALKDVSASSQPPRETYIARFSIKGVAKEKRLIFPAGGQLSVGRIGSNDLVIDEPSVSKIHASLSTDVDHNLVVADTGSTNGTFLNGQRIAYGKAIRLEENESLKFGTVDVRFEHVQREEAAEAETAGEGVQVVEIDGFEFTRRETTATVDESSPAIEVPEGTLPIEAERDDTSTIANRGQELGGEGVDPTNEIAETETTGN